MGENCGCNSKECNTEGCTTCKANECICCTVTQCKNHCSDGKNFCSLEKIKIGTHENNPTVCQCTDCESFVPKNS